MEITRTWKKRTEARKNNSFFFFFLEVVGFEPRAPQE
jgi:hypothetical protein